MQLYNLISSAVSPVDLATAKAWLKVPGTADDAIIQTLISSATEYGEKYTGRDFRVKQWELLIDYFPERICLRRDPVDIINSVNHLVLDTPVTVPSADYYLKKLVQSSEVLLLGDAEWPTDTDDREQAITINFDTKAYYCINEIVNAILTHVAYLYTNRGDCSEGGALAGVSSFDSLFNSGAKSGANSLYNQFRIPRV